MTTKVIFDQTGKAKAHRNYEANPCKTKKQFDAEIDQLQSEIETKRKERRIRKDEPYVNCIDNYYSKKSIYSYVRNYAKKGNDYAKVIIDRTITKPVYDIDIDHRDYAKSSRYWKGYDYETYILRLPIAYTVQIIDDIVTVFQAKAKKIGDYTARPAYIFDRKGITKCVLVQKNNYSSHAVTLKKGAKDIAKKQKKDNPTLTLDTKMTRKKYHALTGACEIGIDSFCRNHNLENVENITVSNLLKIEENFYGKDKIKKMIVA